MYTDLKVDLVAKVDRESSVERDRHESERLAHVETGDDGDDPLGLIYIN